MSAVETSIRDELQAAFKASKEASETPETPKSEALEAPKVSEAPEAVPVVEAQERVRDEKGRFVAKEAEPETVDKPAVKQEVPVVEKPAAIAPPNGWSAEAKAKWHELPPEIMAAVQKREQDIGKFTSTRDEHASFGKEIYQTVQPYMPLIQAEGGTPARAIQALLNTAYVLRTGTPEQKKQLLLVTARNYGIDLSGQPTGQPTGQPDEFSALRSEVQELRSALAQRESAIEQQLQTEVQTEVDAFAADPKHPHYAEVKANMAALLSAGAAKDLQDAYDQAVWARPDIRATLLAQQRAEEEQKRVAEAKARAEAAKRKSISITGGPGASSSSAPARSLREELEANFAASSGAV
jgi:hypothetical protein